MASYILQDGSEPLPHGILRLLMLTEPSETHFLDVWSDEAPMFHIVTYSAAEGSRLPHELVELLHETRRSTGVQYFLLRPPHAVTQNEPDDMTRLINNKVSRTIIWLGPAADNSDAAVRLLSRLQTRAPNVFGRRLWSRREGQALLALADRPTWKHLSLQSAEDAQNLWLCAGTSGVSWDTLLHFRQLLADLEAQGRMEHHHFANALMASKASEAMVVVISRQESQHTCLEMQYPPPLVQTASQIEGGYDLQNLSSQLDHCVTTVDTRWTMLSNEVQVHSTPDLLSEAELDAEIARYTQMLQQMDVLEMDLQHLDDLATATSVHCRQAEAHTPRASPEVMP